jgi:hypothetical protein
MNYNLEQLNTLRSLKLSEEERGLVRAHVQYVMTTAPIVQHAVPSLFQRGLHHGLRIALSSFAFFIFVGGFVSAVAANALPGDPLYPVKISFNEEIQLFFQKTPEKKVAYNAKRVEARVNEIKTLAETKTLTKANQATVQKALDAHIKELSIDLTTLSDTAPSAALAVTTTLEDALKVNKALLETDTNPDPATEVAVQTVTNTIQEVSNQEVKIISKEIDAIAADIIATSTTAIDPIPETSTNEIPPVNTPVEP